jgi:hypothetical protein
MQLTKKLIHAESNYRDAVRRLRELDQSVATDDSTHLSPVSTVPPTIDHEYTRVQKARNDGDVAIWRDRVVNSGPSSAPRWYSGPETSDPSIVQVEDYLSIFGRGKEKERGVITDCFLVVAGGKAALNLASLRLIQEKK